MSFKDYIKDKISYILMLSFVVVTSEILMIPFNIHIFVRIYIGIVPFIGFLICFFIEYYQKRNYYNNLKRKLDDLDEKYKEYIELWIHEIKLPIATGKMIIENNKSEITESIDEELDKIENYIEQALFYARSNVTEKDYYIKKQSLKEIVNTAILKNKRSLLQNKVKLNLHELKGQVYTDSKWCVFIINQIIQNAVKYGKPNNKEIEIFDKSNKENTVLYIKDNGIGIREGETVRVFEKGFTGTNGRKIGQKSTGIGLYLCKKLCDKLGLKIELDSKENIGTEIRIIFPKGSFIQEVRE